MAPAAAPAAAIAATPPHERREQQPPGVACPVRPPVQIDLRQYTASTPNTIASTTDARREQGGSVSPRGPSGSTP